MSSLVTQARVTLVVNPNRLNASVARRTRICSAARLASLARSLAVELLTAIITSVTRHATKANAYHVKRTHLARFTAPVDTTLLRVFWADSVIAVSSLCPFVTHFAKGSCPVANTSASNSAIMDSACAARKLSTKAASATRASLSILATK